MTTRTFRAPLVGMRFRPPAEYIVNMLPGGTVLRVELQEDNPYDPDAISVWLDGFCEGGKAETLWRTIYNAIELEDASKLPLLVNPIMLGFIANSEKTGGKFASTIKTYLQMDGRNGVDCSLSFDAQARPTLVFEWDSDGAIPEAQKQGPTTSPLEAVEKKPLKEDLNDDIPF